MKRGWEGGGGVTRNVVSVNLLLFLCMYIDAVTYQKA